MAGSGFTADPAATRAGAAELDPLADQVDGVREALATVIGSAGACWGGDEAGQAFAKEYVPGAQSAVEVLTGLAEHLRALRRGVDADMTQYEASDDAARRSLPGREA
jgi:uncharacterized protein YukE